MGSKNTRTHTHTPHFQKTSNNFSLLFTKEMERHSHGRLYVKGLPPEWTWWETHQWVTKTLCLPAPSWVHMHSRKPGADVVSAYLHWHKPTVGQLTTYQEHLSNKFLTHRRTEASIAQDEFGPPKSKPPQPSPYGQATWLKQDVPRYKTLVGTPW